MTASLPGIVTKVDLTTFLPMNKDTNPKLGWCQVSTLNELNVGYDNEKQWETIIRMKFKINALI